jgi:hypothetical protein
MSIIRNRFDGERVSLDRMTFLGVIGWKEFDLEDGFLCYGIPRNALSPVAEGLGVGLAVGMEEVFASFVPCLP